MPRSLATIVLAALGLFASLSTASAETITVCASGCDHISIQEAIDAAAAGDTILLDAGTHTLDAQLVFGEGEVNKPLQILGRVAPDGTPITELHAVSESRCLFFSEAVGSDTVVRNLVLTGGGGLNRGGAAFCLGSPTFVNCRFIANTALQRGGAIWNAGGPGFYRCLFAGNQAGLRGGAIWNATDASCDLIRCFFRDNASDAGGGDAISNAEEVGSVRVALSSFCNQVAPDQMGEFEDFGRNCFATDCTDTDGDGIPDDCDRCPGMDDTLDSDGDGIPDCLDACESDPDKVWPGYCGCGVTETDTDGDGVPDCVDDCPGGDDTIDSDGDGTPDGCDDDAIWTVCPSGCDYPTIRQAIVGAEDGDSIQLAAAVYRVTQPIDLQGKQLVITGVPDDDGDGMPETIIDGQGICRVFECISGEPPGTILRDLVVTGGMAEQGGGMSIRDSSPRLERCVFLLNTSSSSGGGLEVADASPVLVECVFRENHSDKDGGGLKITRGDLTARACIFDGNSSGVAGGGLCQEDAGSALLVDCEFLDNEVLLGPVATGGGLFSKGAELRLVSCSFVGNTADSGGGAYFGGNVDSRVIRCDFSSNLASDGGGIFVLADGVGLRSTLVCGNGGVQVEGDYDDIGGNIIRQSCEAVAGESGDADADGVLDWFDNCPFTFNPAQADDDGDGTGDPCDSCPGTNDHVDGDGDGLPDCEDPCPKWAGDCLVIGGKGTPAIQVEPGESINEAIEAIPDGGVVQLAAGVHPRSYKEPIDTQGKAFLLRGEPDADGDGLPETVLDGNGLQIRNRERRDTVLKHLLFTCTPGAGTPSEIDIRGSPTFVSCVFRNNRSNTGGAILVRRGNPLFINCIFQDNTTLDRGGGLLVKRETGAEIESSLFIGNSVSEGIQWQWDIATSPDDWGEERQTGGRARGDSWGTAIHGEPGSTITITNTIVCDNGTGAGQQIFSEGEVIGDGLCDAAICNDCDDDDGDGVPNGQDLCPGADDTLDADADGTPDCLDDCEHDPNKTEPGVCGCGVPDLDTDRDGTPDCNDPCPEWPGDCSDDGTTLTVAVGQSITEAIAAAPVGGVVSLGAGTHPVTVTVDTNGKAITIRGVADADGDGVPETILDGGGSGRVVMCQDGEGPDTVFRNLVIENGASTTGSGMRIADSAPTIADCVFRFNAGTNAGGAVFILRSSPDFQDCRFQGNETTASGGALALNTSHVTMAGCIIRDNSAGSNGGAINLQNDSTIEVSDSTMCDNSESQVAGIDGFIDVGGNCIAETCEDIDEDGVPDECDPCPADLNGDDEVDGADLAYVLGYWGSDDPTADINGDGEVDGADLAYVLGYWGICAAP